MDSGNGGHNFGTGGDGFGNAQGGNPNPNPGGGSGGQPYHYGHNLREDGQDYPANNNPSQALPIDVYHPAGDIPPKNDRELASLLDHRLQIKIKQIGYNNCSVFSLFHRENMVDKIAKERLFAHIYDHRYELPAAYAQLDVLNGAPKWGRVRVTTYIIESLYNSAS